MAEYNLDALGWYQFERLCQTLLKSSFSAAIEAWGGSGDHGIDAYYEGELDFPSRGLASDGPFVFQAKFIAGANAAGARFLPALRGAVKSELARIQERKVSFKWRYPRHYTLLTNAPVSANARRDLTQIVGDALTGCKVHVLAASDLDSMLDASETIRLSFPQLLGLRDLRQLIAQGAHADVLTRSRIEFELAIELADSYVPTDAHRRALSLLGLHNFVVLTGPPEMGKTATARMIALGRLSGGWDAHECVRPEDFFRLHDKSRPQVFVADDAFGSTEYRPELAQDWARDLERIIAAVDDRHWVIWTSRPAPLEQALQQLHFQGRAGNFPQPARVQVNTAVLDTKVKALMLYRHAKAQGLTDDQRAVVRKLAESIVMDENFTPLRILRLVRDDIPRIVALPQADREAALRDAIASGLRAPTRALKTSFNSLSPEHKRLLLAMLDSSSGSTSENILLERYRRQAPPDSSVNPSDLLDMIDDHFLVRRRTRYGFQR